MADPPPDESAPATTALILLVFGAVALTIGLAVLYGLVRFVKWAWEG